MRCEVCGGRVKDNGVCVMCAHMHAVQPTYSTQPQYANSNQYSSNQYEANQYSAAPQYDANQYSAAPQYDANQYSSNQYTDYNANYSVEDSAKVFSIISMATGIGSLFFGIPFAIAALVLASIYQKKTGMLNSMARTGKKFAIASIIIYSIAVIGYIAWVVFIFFISFVAALAGM